MFICYNNKRNLIKIKSYKKVEISMKEQKYIIEKEKQDD